MRGLTDKTFLVTGGGQGLGLAIAQRLLDEGANVGIADIHADSAKQAARDWERAEAFGCDVTEQEEIRKAIVATVNRFGGLDGVVNCAMWIKYEPVEAVAESDLDRMLAVGFKGVVFSTQAALPYLRAAGGGAIVNFSSPAAEVAIANASIYCAVKGAIAAYTRQQAMELGPEQIRVNSIAPGPIRTPGASAVVSEEGYELRAQRTPMGRLGTPEDIASMAAFLLSEDAAFVTGESFRVDGGLTIATISKS